MSKTTARIQRELRRADLSGALVRALANRDVTQRELSASTGADDCVVQRWCDRERPESPSVADLPGMPSEVALDLLRWATEQVCGPDGEKYGITRLPVFDRGGDDYQRLAAAIKESGEACSKHAEILSGAGWTHQNCRELIKEANEAIVALLALRELAEARFRR